MQFHVYQASKVIFLANMEIKNEQGRKRPIDTPERKEREGERDSDDGNSQLL